MKNTPERNLSSAETHHNQVVFLQSPPNGQGTVKSMAEWRIYPSVNLAITGSDNGLMPVWRQTIIWTNASNNIVNGLLGASFRENITIFIKFNFIENVICKMVAILLWSPFWYFYEFMDWYISHVCEWPIPCDAMSK